MKKIVKIRIEFENGFVETDNTKLIKEVIKICEKKSLTPERGKQ